MTIWEGTFEVARFCTMLAILVLLVLSARRHASSETKDLWLVTIGFFLLFFGTVVDVLDDYETIYLPLSYENRALMGFLEKGIGYLGGFVFIAFGFSRWPPLISQLRRAQSEASNANEAKSQFLAHMSHELRTPLNSIIGYSELIQTVPSEETSHEKQRDWVNSIHLSGQHLLNLINNILDLSRVEAGEFPFNEEFTNLEGLLEESVILVQGSSEASGKHIRLKVESSLPLVLTDPHILKKIIVNLLSNALKFSPDGETVLLSAEVVADDTLQISIQDNGAGISEQDLSQIFTPFIQAHTDIHKTHRGTGLGLPLTKSFIELHNGTLELKSTLGRGTTALVALPITRQSPEQFSKPLDTQSELGS